MAVEYAPIDTSILTSEIHRSLWFGDIPNQLVTGHDGRALAVKIPNLLDDEYIQQVVPRILSLTYAENGYLPEQRQTDITKAIEEADLGGVLASNRNSSEQLPDSVVRAADMITKALAGSSDVLAINLTASDDGHLRRDTPRHFDNPTNPFRIVEDTKPGMNLHIAYSGERQVEFGLLDDPDVIFEAARLMQTADNPDDTLAMTAMDAKLGALYRDACSSWAVVTQRPGDGLVFQGEARPERYPIVHKFISVAGAAALHGFGLIKPSFAPAEDVLDLRQRAQTVIDRIGHPAGA